MGKEFTIFCDGCSTIGGASITSHAEARMELRQFSGWRCDRRGDLCSECVPRPQEDPIDE